jgi:hypothetical protein
MDIDLSGNCSLESVRVRKHHRDAELRGGFLDVSRLGGTTVKIYRNPSGSTRVRQRTNHDVLRTKNTRDLGSNDVPRDYSRVVHMGSHSVSPRQSQPPTPKDQ